jgi:tRNA A37 threonylcarbamoyladenosine biosynthesis protein TsaE
MSFSQKTTPIVPFQSGSPIMIAGPTGVGKTFFTYQLLKHPMFTEKVKSILYCYGVHQPFYDQMELDNIVFHQGVPTLEMLKNLNDDDFHVVVLDDLMEEIVKSVESQNLFTKYCHHFHLTVIFLTQNLFAQGPYARTISLNTHILVLFANKRDESQSLQLAKQLYPGASKLFLEVYEDATSKPFGYLVIDCDPKSPRDIKLRTNIFPGEQTVCYVKK